MIAQWTTIDHVAYVERVNNSDGSIDVSEYNYGADDGGIKHQYGVRNVPPGSFPDEFIHISRLSLSPTNLDFGSRAAGTSSSQTITVTNSLAQTISLSLSVGASNAGVGTTDFTEINTCGGTKLSPGTECEITVTFAPPSALTKGAPQSAAITLNWNAGPQLIPVKGLALTNLTPSPQSLPFGSVAVGSTAMKTVILKNEAGANVVISSISTGSTVFTATGCGNLLTQGSSCTISVKFSPTAKGQQAGTLTIIDNAINSPQMVNLKGKGI